MVCLKSVLKSVWSHFVKAIIIPTHSLGSVLSLKIFRERTEVELV